MHGAAPPSLPRICIAATLSALPGLAAAAALAPNMSGWSLLVGAVVATGVSYSYAAFGQGKSSGDAELAIVWTLASYVAWICLAAVAFAVVIALSGSWLPD